MDEETEPIGDEEEIDSMLVLKTSYWSTTIDQRMHIFLLVKIFIPVNQKLIFLISKIKILLLNLSCEEKGKKYKMKWLTTDFTTSQGHAAQSRSRCVTILNRKRK